MRDQRCHQVLATLDEAIAPLTRAPGHSPVYGIRCFTLRIAAIWKDADAARPKGDWQQSVAVFFKMCNKPAERIGAEVDSQTIHFFCYFRLYIEFLSIMNKRKVNGRHG